MSDTSLADGPRCPKAGRNNSLLRSTFLLKVGGIVSDYVTNITELSKIILQSCKKPLNEHFCLARQADWGLLKSFRLVGPKTKTDYPAASIHSRVASICRHDSCPISACKRVASPPKWAISLARIKAGFAVITS